ncbi:hypothetical protein SPRG_17602 [Saprolegnia parasitica CBS 223.65]|uniref:Peptidase C1A papain C-terminal domain-containing protein n=1 Tax=Saprolegnia parasitica (strain CBS 223.65) TaxID=695850 RepID=A0A067BJN1_SAPPC|nr:hypothetical protein SPRG_17602 [Saprolegnia parasitica CBS 223.65]KDO16940.1 hypothetical protein SPRG_17602 [Saprolegnia parasitica CBS 223.65]|eukprot:XP_012212351.1 hypothetical protein SPRG_17602 [Saprolegnia parasitica CBS 223.65]
MPFFFFFSALAAAIGAQRISDAERPELNRDLALWQQKFGSDDDVRVAMASVKPYRDELLRRIRAAKEMLPSLQEANPHATFSHLTKFALLTDEEFARFAMVSARPLPERLSPATRTNPTALGGPVVKAVDWTKQSVCVPPVKTMGKCRSHWAIAAAAVVSSAHCLATGEAIDLSEQQVLSCTTPGGANGCRGGFATTGMKWLVSQPNSVCSRSAIPYVSGASGSVSICSDNSKCAGSISLQVGNVFEASGDDALVEQLQKQPVVAYVTTSNISWRLYAGGVISWCPAGYPDQPGGQAVLVVGYGTQDTGYGSAPIDFFKVRNAWGTNWGEAGDIRLARGDRHRGTCEVTTYLSYPTLQLPAAIRASMTPTTVDARSVDSVVTNDDASDETE